MVDIVETVQGRYDRLVKDMGDGTHAPVVAIGEIAGELPVSGPLTDTELRATAVPTSVGAITLPSAIFAGQKAIATAGTQEALASSQALVSGVRIKAKIGNTGNVFVGNADVDSTHGFILGPGDEVFVEIANLATVYLDVGTNGDGVSYVAS